MSEKTSGALVNSHGLAELLLGLNVCRK